MEDHRKRRLGSPVPSSGGAAQKRKLSSLVSGTLDGSGNGRNGSSPATTAGGLLTPGTGAFDEDPDETEDEAENALDAALGLENGFIERFRKGALHRQLLEARREHERAAKKAFKLQSDLDSTRQRLSRTEASWLQLVDEIRAAVGYTGHSTSQGLVNGHSEDDAATQHAHEAKQLVAAFVTKLATGELNRDILRRCEMLSAELAESRSAYTLLESVLAQTREELTIATEALRLAQRKADRERDATIAKLDARTHSAEASRRAQDKAEKEAAEQAKAALLEQQQRAPPVIVKSEKRSTSPSAGNAVKAEAESGNITMKVDDANQEVGSSGLTSSEIQELQRLAQYRLDEMESLRKDKTLLQLEVETMKRRTVNPQVDVVKSTSVYKALVADYERAKRDCDIANNALPVLKEETAALRLEQTQQREAIESELATQLEELTKKYAQTAHDLGRIRAERDTRLGELAEAHAAKDAKSKHTDQMRLLAENRQMRINVLASELQRLRMKLAADGGDKQTVDLISQQTKDSNEPADNRTSANGILPEEIVVRHLQEELRTMNHMVQVMKQNLAAATGLSEASEDLDMAEQLMRDCAQANANAETATLRVKQLESLLEGSDSPSIATLAKSIDRSTDTIKRLEANAAIANTTTNMLVAEVSRLSEAWDTLNKQNHDKIFDLAGYEKKLEQYSIDKQKATQKYFASERDKEAILQQHKSLSAAKEQQAKVLEVQDSAQKALLAQLASVKSEVAEHQSLLAEAELKISEKTTTINKETASAESARREVAALQALYDSRAKLIETESAGRAKAEERIIKLESELEKAKKRAESASAAAAGKGRIPDLDVRELQTECQNLHTLLRCSSCKLRFKSHILLRCSHLLCKECIDARLDTRQRKCPTCQTAFGAADVQQVYMNA